jgi:hypothetical protein
MALSLVPITAVTTDNTNPINKNIATKAKAYHTK